MLLCALYAALVFLQGISVLAQSSPACPNHPNHPNDKQLPEPTQLNKTFSSVPPTQGPPNPYASARGAYRFEAFDYGEPYMLKSSVIEFVSIDIYPFLLGQVSRKITRLPFAKTKGEGKNKTNRLTPVSPQQALSGPARWDSSYCVLPTHLASSNMVWKLRQGRDTGNVLLYGDMAYWVEFIIQFLHLWREEDWVPSFEMALVHEVSASSKARFEGRLFGRPPSG